MELLKPTNTHTIFTNTLDYKYIHIFFIVNVSTTQKQLYIAPFSLTVFPSTRLQSNKCLRAEHKNLH